MPPLLRPFLALLLLTTLSLPAWAAEPCTAPLRVGMSQLGVSYTKGADGVGRGHDVDIARELARRLGCEFQVVEMNRVRIFQSLERGEFIDMATSVSQTPERDQYAQFVQLAITRNYLLVNKRLAGADFDLNRFTAAPSLRMGVLAGSNYGPFINARLTVLSRQDRVETTQQAELLIPRLIAGRYDGLVVTPVYFIAALKELKGGEDIRVLPIAESDSYRSGFYLSHKAQPEARRQQIRDALRAIHQDGTLLRIYRNYFPEAMARERAGFAPETAP